MKKCSLILCCSFSLFLAGCSTLYTVVPTAIVESPDIVNSESGQKELYFRSDSAKLIQLVGDASSRPLNPGPQEVKTDIALTGGLNFSLAKRFQYGISISPDSLWFDNFAGMIRLMAKYQVFKTDNDKHTIAIFGHALASKSSMKGNQDGVFGPGGYPWHASSNGWGLNAGTSYGYRFSDHYLAYLGAAYESFGISGKVDQGASVTGDYPAASAELSYSKGYSRTINIGLVVGKTGRLTMNYSVGDLHWNNLMDTTHFLSLGYSGLIEK
jgi:hypothetical protein